MPGCTGGAVQRQRSNGQGGEGNEEKDVKIVG